MTMIISTDGRNIVGIVLQTVIFPNRINHKRSILRTSNAEVKQEIKRNLLLRQLYNLTSNFSFIIKSEINPP